MYMEGQWLYSAGQKFRTFNGVDFLWPPWERGANFEHSGVWNSTIINCPPLPKFTYLLQEG